MLAPEVAKERLKTWEIEADETRYLPEIKALPTKLRTIAYGLLGRDAKGEEFAGGELAARQTPAEPGHSATGRVDFQGPVAAVRPVLLRARSGDRVCLATAQAISLSGDARAKVVQGRRRRKHHLREARLLAGRHDARRRRVEIRRADAAWLAAWAPHLGRGYGVGHDSIGRLLAAVINGGGKVGDEVFDILRQSIRNEHEVGGMGRHVIRGLLMASRPEGWELVEKTLIAAQRQEGLRQVILETVDEAHPEAYLRMLRLIRDQELARFSSVVRAVNVWFGLNWDSVSVTVVNTTIDRAIGFLEDPGSRDRALAGNDQDAIFLALWSVAFTDVLAAIPLAAKLLKHEKTEVRFMTAMHLGQMALPQSGAALLAALDDEDLRVADCACWAWPRPRSIPTSGKTARGSSSTSNGCSRAFRASRRNSSRLNVPGASGRFLRKRSLR